jgi:NADPH-dependent glutamate synthase beta subunit-like oxidoreductase
MPAFPQEIEEALREGVRLEELVSPTAIHTREGRIASVELIRNTLGPMEPSGRRSFVALAGTNFSVPVDTLVVAIGEQLLAFAPSGSEGIEIRQGAIMVNPEALQTSRPGVFAGGDVVTGPSTVVKAIAAGRRAAIMIDRYLTGQKLEQPGTPVLPKVYLEPHTLSDEELERIRRAEPPTISLEKRRTTFAEVELCLSEEDARREAMRCLRCDLAFTLPAVPEGATVPVEPLSDHRSHQGVP